MHVGDIMTPNPITIGPHTSVEEVQRLFEEHHFHHVLVVDCGELVGVVSDRDLLKNLSPFVGNTLAERPQDLALLRRHIHLVMTRRPVCVQPETPVGAAAWLMRDKQFSCLPVVDDQQRPIGLVTATDLLAVLSRPMPPAPNRTWSRLTPSYRLPPAGRERGPRRLPASGEHGKAPAPGPSLS
jgi:acetoin utilization protein AcuB